MTEPLRTPGGRALTVLGDPTLLTLDRLEHISSRLDSDPRIVSASLVGGVVGDRWFRATAPAGVLVAVAGDVVDLVGALPSADLEVSAPDWSEWFHACTERGLWHDWLITSDPDVSRAPVKLPTSDLDSLECANLDDIDSFVEAVQDSSMTEPAPRNARLTVTVDVTWLGPFETGPQVLITAAIDALARREDVEAIRLVGVSKIPDYAAHLLDHSSVQHFAAVRDVPRSDILWHPNQITGEGVFGSRHLLADRVVTTFLDLISYDIPRYHVSAQAWRAYRARQRQIAVMVDGVSTISADVAERMCHAVPRLDSARVQPIVLGLDHIGAGDSPAQMPMALATLGSDLAGRGFVLVLGKDFAHKNRDFAIRVWQQALAAGQQCDLVLAGLHVNFSSLHQFESDLRARHLDSRGRIHQLDHVDAESRAWLLANAAVVLYPTSAEGFGLVPYEAAALGTPSTFADFGPLREVSQVGDLPAGWRLEEFSADLVRMLTDPIAAQERVTALQAAIGRHTWAGFARQLVEFFTRVATMPPTPGRLVGMLSPQRSVTVDISTLGPYVPGTQMLSSIKAVEALAQREDLAAIRLVGVTELPPYAEHLLEDSRIHHYPMLHDVPRSDVLWQGDPVDTWAAIDTRRALADRLVTNYLDLIRELAEIGEGVNESGLAYRERLAKAGDVEPGVVEHDVQISILVPVYNPPVDFLRECLRSVLAQSSATWQLVVADDGSTDADVLGFLETFATEHAGDPRIVVLRQANGGISSALNAALAQATGEYVGMLDHDDLLDPRCIEEFATAIESAPVRPDAVYSDEDKVSPRGEHYDVYCKPDFSPDLLLTQMYLCHFTVFRRSDVVEIGGLRSEMDGAQDFDLALRLLPRLQQVIHLPRPLNHVCARSQSVALTPEVVSRAQEVEARVQRDHLERTFGGGTVAPSAVRGLNEVHPRIDASTRVSVIIPTIGKGDGLGGRLVDAAVRTLVAGESRLSLEFVIVTTGVIPDVVVDDLRGHTLRHVVYDTASFNFSEAINLGRSVATGEYVLLLNDDTTVAEPDPVSRLLEIGQQEGVGVTGCLLTYPDGRIQHAGVVLLPGGPTHCWIARPGRDPGYFGSTLTPRNYLAVTAAAMLVRTSVFDELGGFDPAFAVDFNDVDFCLRAVQAGYRVAWTPYAHWTHHENATFVRRLSDSLCTRTFRDRWASRVSLDPYYSPALNPRLDRIYEAL